MAICPKCKHDTYEELDDMYYCTNCGITQPKKSEISPEIIKEVEILKEMNERMKQRFTKKRKMIITDEDGNTIDEYNI